MPENLELKVKCGFLANAESVAQRLGSRRIRIMRQIDTYFNVPSGRLKLRECDDGRSELIWYQRPDRQTSRFSHYTVVKVAKPKEIRRTLARLFGIRVVVRKHRVLYLLKNARIHIDSVRNLGSFVEFEVMVRHGRGQAERFMRKLRKAFHVDAASVVASSYSDLLLTKRRNEK